MRALLMLADGTRFEARSLGKTGTTTGEVVFSTGMTGYQETLTDPSFAGQIVCLTYPLVGNYGINDDDFESTRVQVAGFAVREAAEQPCNWRCRRTLDQYLKDTGTVSIQGIDTRELTRCLRQHGVMPGGISTELKPDQLLDLIRAAPEYAATEFVAQVTTPTPYAWPFQGTPKYEVALLDCGVKFAMMRNLAARGMRATVYPSGTPAEAILERNPDGVVFSSGPGDPARLGHVVRTIRSLSERRPTMGVCLGNQLLGYAYGSRTDKLKFGHRGANHPVRDLHSGRVIITSQNHGYALRPDELEDGMEVAFINLNDGTVEGLRHRELPIFSIQYHPEASPGPNDSRYFFDEFAKMMDAAKG